MSDILLGHINHSLFWENLAPKSMGGGELPDASSPLAKAVSRNFGSFDKLITTVNGQVCRCILLMLKTSLRKFLAGCYPGVWMDLDCQEFYYWRDRGYQQGCKCTVLVLKI